MLKVLGFLNLTQGAAKPQKNVLRPEEGKQVRRLGHGQHLRDVAHGRRGGGVERV